ncbi:glycosyltransferase family 1 protein [Gracilibacillus lacisalsi]|uniref:glycosyltransferase family 1 protein n=1 Tax=Gracilibacillus lacisalsi TaxID=393087 RepID=UPI000375210E|nr:glycosyltransferase family 1 protein [Gracilibacillus lacisalsi]
MKEPIRVLHIFGRLDAGGAESRTMDIYRSIDRTKVQFDFAIHTTDECYFSSEIRSMGGKIYSLPRFTGKNYLSYKKAWRDFFSKHTEYRIVHGHQTSTAFVYLREARKKSVPIRIAHSRNSNKENVIKKYLCKLSRFNATNLFAVSKKAGISEFGKKAVKNNTVKVIPNAINTSRFLFNQDTRIAKRSELGFKDELVIVHVGRFHPQKNHRLLLEIFKKVNEKQKNSKLILIGDGPLKQEIEKQTKIMNLENAVFFKGIRSDVSDFLQAADVLLFPSLYEGLPGVVLEAQAAGIPCIISDQITKEVRITKNVTFIPLERSPEFWAESLMENYFKHIRKNHIKEFTESGFDVNSTVKWYEKFYTEALKNF